MRGPLAILLSLRSAPSPLPARRDGGRVSDTWNSVPRIEILEVVLFTPDAPPVRSVLSALDDRLVAEQVPLERDARLRGAANPTRLAVKLPPLRYQATRSIDRGLRRRVELFV